jgi:hypothetical protein
MRGLLRWRKWPEEKPDVSDSRLAFQVVISPSPEICRWSDYTAQAVFTINRWFLNEMRSDDDITDRVQWWRPIGPMPEGCGECERLRTRVADLESENADLRHNEARIAAEKEVERLEGLLRWRKWPEERPTEPMAVWICTFGGSKGVGYFNGKEVNDGNNGWNGHVTQWTHWRPIGPMPEGGE